MLDKSRNSIISVHENYSLSPRPLLATNYRVKLPKITSGASVKSSINFATNKDKDKKPLIPSNQSVRSIKTTLDVLKNPKPSS